MQLRLSIWLVGANWVSWKLTKKKVTTKMPSQLITNVPIFRENRSLKIILSWPSWQCWGVCQCIQIGRFLKLLVDQFFTKVVFWVQWSTCYPKIAKLCFVSDCMHNMYSWSLKIFTVARKSMRSFLFIFGLHKSWRCDCLWWKQICGTASDGSKFVALPVMWMIQRYTSVPFLMKQWRPVWPDKIRQMSIKVAQKWIY